MANKPIQLNTSQLQNISPAVAKLNPALKGFSASATPTKGKSRQADMDFIRASLGDISKISNDEIEHRLKDKHLVIKNQSKKGYLLNALHRNIAEVTKENRGAKAIAGGLGKFADKLSRSGSDTSSFLSNVSFPGGVGLPLAILLILFFSLIPVAGHTRLVWWLLAFSGGAQLSVAGGSAGSTFGTGSGGDSTTPSIAEQLVQGGGWTGRENPFTGYYERTPTFSAEELY